MKGCLTISIAIIIFLSCRHKDIPPCPRDAGGPNNGGFEVLPYSVMETPPGMVLVEGGTFLLSEEGYESVRKKVLPFFISIYEETNRQYLAYVTYVKKYYSRATYLATLPDTTVWNMTHPVQMAEYLSKIYFRHPAFRDHPVVGVSPDQILQYAAWKTDQMNEMILIREGVLDFDSTSIDSVNRFSTDAYLAGKYVGNVKNLIPMPDGNERKVRMEDGILLPSFRLPIIEEWEVAALAIGDKENKYVNTDPESKARKFDKKNCFGHLYPPKQKVKERGPSKILIDLGGTKEFYLPALNKYFIAGLADNVSEIVMEGKNFSVIGGSWRTSAIDYTAVYNVSSPDSIKYIKRNKFKVMREKGYQVASATGFRLAMSWVGFCPEMLINKRSKR